MMSLRFKVEIYFDCRYNEIKRRCYKWENKKGIDKIWEKIILLLNGLLTQH